MENIKLHDLTKSRLSNILALFSGLHIGVIGDLALDAYWYADMTRAFLSRETPHFPRPVISESYTCGAGANVADNVKALGVGHVTVLSVLGDDWRGVLLQRVMAQQDIDCTQLLVSSQRFTTAYIKPILMGYESKQEDARIDFENNSPLTEALEYKLLDVIKQNLPALDAVVIADQLEVNGIVTSRVREGLNILASEHPNKLFVVDSRARIGSFDHMILKPNKQEAMGAIDADIDPDTASFDDWGQVAGILSHRTTRPVFLTLGEQGVLVYADGHVRHCPAGPTHPPVDPVGAGDTFIAAISAALTARAVPWEAAIIANLAAAVTVEKLNQTGTASPPEIMARYNLISEAHD
jgi:rfaE bifunctional protein kinase chain/domain